MFTQTVEKSIVDIVVIKRQFVGIFKSNGFAIGKRVGLFVKL